MGKTPIGKLGEDPAEDGNGNKVEIVSEKVAFQRYGVVFDRCVRYPDGDLISFDIWSKNWRNSKEFCQCVPYDSKTNTVTMIKEYFPAHHKFLWGFPGGNVEEKHGSPTSAIQAELEEEAQLFGGRWISLLEDHKTMPQDKYQEDSLYMYLVVDAERKDVQATAAADKEEIISVVHGVSIETVISKIRKGELQSNGVATFFLALETLRNEGFYPK